MKPITLAGSNSFGLRRRLAQLTDEFVKKYGDLALERIDCEEAEPSQITEAVQSLPFLSERKMVVLRNLGANKLAAEQIEQIIDSAAEQIELVIVEPAPDKRTVFYKTLVKKTELESFDEPDSSALGRWVVEEASRLGAKISLGDANYLIERLGPNQQMLASELAKLAIGSSEITRQHIDDLSEPTPQSKVFDLLDAAFAGNRAKALKLYEDQRAQRAEPQMILAMIAWQLRNLVAAKLDKSRTAARDLGISPYVLGKSASLARNVPAEKLQKLISQALEIDYRSKTSALDLDAALKNYLLTIS